MSTEEGRIWFKVVCEHYQTKLLATRDAAERRKQSIEDMGACHLHHEIVECYSNGMKVRTHSER